jgi:hypothetical protein
MLLGVLLTVGIAGVFLHVEKNKALQAEVVSLRDEIKEKSLALDETSAQIEALSRQINALKECSVARSSPVGGKDKKEGSAPSAEAAANEPKAPETAEKAGSPEAPPPPKVKKPKPKPSSQNCELVGKSPEEQTATLKRCVGLLDSPKEKPGSH